MKYIYPYWVYSKQIVHRPIFNDVKGDPFLAELAPGSSLLQGVDARDQRQFQRILERKMENISTWGLSPYLENRETLLAGCPQMVEEKRFFHLGLDVIVGLGKPLHAPLDAVVKESGHEEGEGNYGGYVLLMHQSPFFETFYSFYGHLGLKHLPSPGEKFNAGEPFAEIGDFHENGNWFYHTHLQIITQKGYEKGYIAKGYCTRADLAQMNEFCPSPLPLFVI